MSQNVWPSEGTAWLTLWFHVIASKSFHQQVDCSKQRTCTADEIDAIGKARGMGGGDAGTQEREQGLMQMLYEMDGFASNDGVLVVGATNRVTLLDDALLRKGRFDMTIYMGRPSTNNRFKILQVSLSLRSAQLMRGDLRQLYQTIAICGAVQPCLGMSSERALHGSRLPEDFAASFMAYMRCAEQQGMVQLGPCCWAGALSAGRKTEKPPCAGPCQGQANTSRRGCGVGQRCAAAPGGRAEHWHGWR